MALIAVIAGAASCWEREPLPLYPQLGPSGGYAPDDFDFEAACSGGWEYGTNDADARKHTSFPERVPEGCYTQVHYDPVSKKITSVSAPSEGCGFPHAGAKERLLARAAVYEAVARAPSLRRGDRVPMELACELPADVRRAAAQANALTLRSYAESIHEGGDIYPYAVAGTFGFGEPAHNGSELRAWRPGAPCVGLSAEQREILNINLIRAGRIADAYASHVAPLVSVSGGAVHADLVEAFMLGHLAHCEGKVPQDRILYDPCADHTHTNFRNTGAILKEMDARFAYLVTDDFLQSKYMQEWTTFDAIGGSIDQRALRDWGYLLGAWRQASSGIDAGFWFTPYRFWAEPREGRGSFACVGDVPYDP